MVTEYHGDPILTAHRRVAPTTSRVVNSDAHEPVVRTLHLTETERVTLRTSLEKWIPYSDKRRAIRDALLLTLTEKHDGEGV